MAGVVLETLSTKKLYVFVCALLLGLAIFFLLGGLIGKIFKRLMLIIFALFTVLIC